MLIGIFDSESIDTSNPVLPYAVTSMASYIGYTREPVRGYGSYPSVFLPAESVSFDDTHSLEPVSFLTGRFLPKEVTRSDMSYSGDISCHLIPYGLTSMLVDALGGTVSTTLVGAKYQHIITPGSAFEKTLCFDTRYDDIMVIRRTGAQVTGASIEASFNELVSSRFTFEGQGSALVESSVSPTFMDVNPFSFSHSYVMLDGAEKGNVKSFSIDISPSLTQDIPLRKATGPSGWYSDGLSVSVKMDVDLDYSDRVLMDAATKASIGLYFDNGKESMYFEFPNCHPSVMSMSAEAGKVSAGMEFTITDDDDDYMTLTVISSESSIA